MKKICPNCGERCIERSKVFFSYLRLGNMVVCPSCQLGVFLKNGIHVPYLGLVREMLLQTGGAVIIVAIMVLGGGVWLTIAVFAALHAMWSWVKSGWKFGGGIESGYEE